MFPFKNRFVILTSLYPKECLAELKSKTRIVDSFLSSITSSFDSALGFEETRSIYEGRFEGYQFYLRGTNSLGGDFKGTLGKSTEGETEIVLHFGKSSYPIIQNVLSVVFFTLFGLFVLSFFFMSVSSGFVFLSFVFVMSLPGRVIVYFARKKTAKGLADLINGRVVAK